MPNNFDALSSAEQRGHQFASALLPVMNDQAMVRRAACGAVTLPYRILIADSWRARAKDQEYAVQYTQACAFMVGVELAIEQHERHL